MAIPDYAVGTRFTARDEVTPAYRRMGDAADAFNRRATRGANDSASAMRNATKVGYQFGTVVKGILAANLIRGGIDRIVNGFQRVGGDFIKFDETMIGASARFNDIGVDVVDLTGKAINLGKGVREAIAGTKFTAVEAATAMNEFAKADFNSVAALGALRSQLELASATNTDFALSTEFSNRLLGAFGMRSKDAQKQIVSHIRLNDMLGAAANIANGDLTTLFETLKTAAPVGTLIGTTPEEMIAMGLTIDKAGIDASMAATSLKRAILNIGSADVQKELRANGIEITDNMGKFRRLSDILGDIGKKLDSKGLARTPELTQIFDRMFGKYGLAGVLGLIKNIDAVKEYEETLHGAIGANKKMDDQLKKSLGYKLEVLGNAAIAKGFEFLDALRADGSTGLDGLIASINRFDMKPVVEGFRTFMQTAKELWPMVSLLIQHLPSLMKLFIGWKMIMIGIPIANFVGGLSGMIGLMPMLTLQCAGLSAALWPISLAMIGIVASYQALKSLFTGQDNFISQAAQSLGIVPKLSTNSDGVVTGRAPDAQQSGFVKSVEGIGSAFGNMRFPSTESIGNQSPPPAPNAKEAAARNSSFFGQLNITGDTKGATLTSSTTGAPPLAISLLGAQ